MEHGIPGLCPYKNRILEYNKSGTVYRADGFITRKQAGEIESMAYRRSLTTSARVFDRRRFTPSLYYTIHEDDRKFSRSDEKVNTFLQSRSYGFFGNDTNASLGFGGGGVGFRDPRWTQFPNVPMTTSLFSSAKSMSTKSVDRSEAEKTEDMADVADAMTDKSMEVVSTINEVAIAAGDSWPPVAVLQYFIGGINNTLGLDWWACIVLATFLIRICLVPIQINLLKASPKLNTLKREVEQITKDLKDGGMSPTAKAEGQERLERASKELVSQFSQLKSLFIQGPVFLSLFLAIQNMVEKVPSFQTGGISWFTDLTTADSFYILPFLAAFTFWINVECNTQEGSEGDRFAGKMKNISRGLAALTFPLTATFPNAYFCYWIPTNVFSLFFGLSTKNPSVKKFLNLPIVAPSLPPSATTQSKPTSEEQKLTSQRLLTSPVVSHRIKNLERELVKGRKKIKRKKNKQR